MTHDPPTTSAPRRRAGDRHRHRGAFIPAPRRPIRACARNRKPRRRHRHTTTRQADDEDKSPPHRQPTTLQINTFHAGTRHPECARLLPDRDQDHQTMRNTDPFQAPPLDNEPQLARTLERVCHQHGATDDTTVRLIADMVASVRAATDLQRVASALTHYEHDNPDPGDLDIILGFTRRALDAAERRAAAAGYAGPADLAPEIRDAIADIVEIIWEREADDYRQQDDTDRADHPHLHLSALHNWLGPYSLVRC